jgi:SAM-dependent methyltransferase
MLFMMLRFAEGPDNQGQWRRIRAKIAASGSNLCDAPFASHEHSGIQDAGVTKPLARELCQGHRQGHRMSDNKQAKAKDPDVLSKDDAAKLETLRQRRAAAAKKDAEPADSGSAPNKQDLSVKPAPASKADTQIAPTAKPATAKAPAPDAPKPVMTPSALRAARTAQSSDQAAATPHTDNARLSTPALSGALGEALRKRQSGGKIAGKRIFEPTKDATKAKSTTPPAPSQPWHVRARQWLNAQILDKYDAPRERIPTSGSRTVLRNVSDGVLELDEEGVSDSAEAQATPRQVIRIALDMLPEPPEGFTFVDLGCGAGRVIYEAARRPFERIVGFERHEERYEAAMANLRLWPRSVMACRDIDIYHQELLDAELPDGDMVAYIFGLDDGRLMSFMASKLARHARQGQRLYLIIVDPKHHGFLDNSPSFSLEPIPPKQRLWLRLISPFAVRIYKVKPSALAEAAASAGRAG